MQPATLDMLMKETVQPDACLDMQCEEVTGSTGSNGVASSKVLQKTFWKP